MNLLTLTFLNPLHPGKLPDCFHRHWTIILIDTLINTYYGKYSGIHLSQVAASIPKEYINSEESERYKTDNEFLIQ